MKTFHLKIVTQEEILYDGDAESVTLPAKMGQMTALPGHAPLFTKLRRGKITYKAGIGRRDVVVTDGIVEVTAEKVTILIPSVPVFLG